MKLEKKLFRLRAVYFFFFNNVASVILSAINKSIKLI